MNKRVEWIDVTKGLAIISVIIGHTIIGSEFSQFNKIIFSFHMPIFFIISGYLYKSQSVKGCIYKNIKKLIVPYWITALCILFGRIFKIILNGDYNSIIYTIKNTIISALYGYGVNNAKGFSNIEMIGAIWFLLALFWAILFYCIVLKLTNTKTENKKISIILALSIIGYLIGQKIWIPLNVDIGMTAIIYLYIGTIMKKMI